MRTSLRPAAAGLTVCLLASLLTAGTTFATTTARTLEVASTDWAAGDDVQGARMSGNGQVFAVQSSGTIPATRPGSSGGHVYAIDLGTSHVEQVNVDSAENGSVSSAWPGGLSFDGRYVTFTNYETPGFGPKVAWIRDRATGTTELVSAADGGGALDGSTEFGDVDISDDGRFVAFTSSATNVLPIGADNNGKSDVFVRDRLLGTTTRVSVGPGGLEGDGDSSGVAISGDGSTVVFTSYASNLLSTPDTNGVADVFAVDIDAATLDVERVSVSSLGVEGDAQSVGCGSDLSADGSIVTFSSQATTLAPDANFNSDVYVRDRVAGTTEKASVMDGGAPPPVGAGSYSPVISADGTKIAYASQGQLDQTADTQPYVDTYLTDRAAGTTELISRTPLGVSGDSSSGDCINIPSVAIDATGQVVAFASGAEDLVPAAADGGHGDLFVSRPAPVDGDADGISDDIDANPGASSLAFDDGSTHGQIIGIPAGFTVTVTDSIDGADGVHIEVTGSGVAKVSFFMCGQFTMRLGANTITDFTCGSIIVAVAPGSAPVEVVFGNDTAVVSIPAGATAEVDSTPGGGFTVDNVTGGTVTVTVDGTPTSVPPGGSLDGNAWDFDGFKAPVDNGGVLNKAKAGKAVALRWRLLDASGQPVTNLATAHLTVVSLACPLGATADQIEEYTTGASGLVSDGHGDYHLNWQTPASYAGSCKTLRLDIGDGVLHTALFQFTK